MSGGFQFPVSPWRRVGFAFGSPWAVNSDGGPFCGGRQRRHTGWDVYAVAGQALVAPADGVLSHHEHDPRWGDGCVIEHDTPEGPVCSVMWHVANEVPDGTRVAKAQRVASVYDLGPNTHHHYGVFLGSRQAYTIRGALPQGDCGGDPSFPGGFVDPDAYVRAHQGAEAGADQEVTMKVITGDATPTVWVTDGVVKRYVDTPGNMATLLALAGQTAVVRVPQYDIDRMPVVQLAEQPDRGDPASYDGRRLEAKVDQVLARGPGGGGAGGLTDEERRQLATGAGFLDRLAQAFRG